MKSNTFKLLLITAGIIIVALCGLGGYLFMESQAMKEAEMANSTMEQAKKDSLKITELAELLRIANERETSIKKENEASAAREKATEDKYNELMAENSNQQNNNYSGNSQNNQIASNGNSSNSEIPWIYSADSFMNAVEHARIRNSAGGLLHMYHNGLWINSTMLTGFAPSIISYNKSGGVLKYKTPDSYTLTFMVDFSSGQVIGHVSGSSQNLFFTIE